MNIHNIKDGVVSPRLTLASNRCWGSDLAYMADTHVSRVVQLCGLTLAFTPTEGGCVALLLVSPDVGAVLWMHEFESFDAVMATLECSGNAYRGEWTGVPAENAKRWAEVLGQADVNVNVMASDGLRATAVATAAGPISLNTGRSRLAP